MKPLPLVLLPLSALALASLASAATPRARPSDSGPEALRASIAALKPAKVVWREIGWRNCPLAALAEARRTNRPVLAWVFLGDPRDERC